jgi:hypothetical protein
MIVCTNCKQPNMTGALYCTECGSMLLAGDSMTTQDISSVSKGSASQGKRPPSEPLVARDTWATLHLVDTGQVLPLSERNEFTMGRSTEGQPVMPDIDLSPYQAYSRGVSRLHAVIKRGIDNIYLMDLDSANGTFLNGKRLIPHEEEPVANGDIMALGKLKIQVLLKAP